MKTLELTVISHHWRDLGVHRTRIFGERGGSIGRSDDNFWVLPDSRCYISGHHCDIEYRDGAYWLHDRSKNGVFVNGSTVPLGREGAFEIHDGDRIRLADFTVLARIRSQSIAQVRIGEETRALGGVRPLDDTNPGMRIPDLAVSDTAEMSAQGTEAGASDVVSRKSPQRERRLRVVAESSAGSPAPESPPRAFPSIELRREAMEANRILLAISDKEAIRAYKILRTRLARRMQAHGWRSVAVTGTAEREGKTLTSVNLAIAMARQSTTPVILVDVDLQRPKVAQYLGISAEKGLTDYLNGDASADEIVYRPVGIERLLVVPTLRPTEHASELLGSERMKSFVQHIEDIVPKHLIIYDMPPVLMSDDVLAFSSNFDALLAVLSVGTTVRTALERVKDVLLEMNLAGVVLNRSIERDKSGYY